MIRLDSARLTLKQHWFEMGAAGILCVLVGAAALFVGWRLSALGVPADCVRVWIADAAAGLACNTNVEAYVRMLSDDAPSVFAAMAVLPFAVGLLGGVPIVGRELEARTAQIAWSIAPSRFRWLVRQLATITVVLGAAVIFAASASEWLEQIRRSALPGPAFDQLGLHGVLAIARAIAALGLGLLAGATAGRTLPGFIVGAALSLILVFAVGAARQGWGASQTLVVLESSVEAGFEGTLVEQGWRDPAGTILRYAEARAIASAVNPQDPESWLLENHYEPIQLGLTAAMAKAWESIETVVFVVVGLGLVGASVLVVERRRPN